jgi:transposase InsO family protein
MMTFAAPAEWRDNGARIRAGVNEADHMSAGPVRRTPAQSRGGRSPAELRHFNAAEANLNTPIMARQDALNWIEMFYNQKRKHVRSGVLSPVEFENII